MGVLSLLGLAGVGGGGFNCMYHNSNGSVNIVLIFTDGIFIIIIPILSLVH